jgi:hypothetical protein
MWIQLLLVTTGFTNASRILIVRCKVHLYNRKQDEEAAQPCEQLCSAKHIRLQANNFLAMYETRNHFDHTEGLTKSNQFNTEGGQDTNSGVGPS